MGSDIEMAKYIADKLGVELKIVPLEFAAVLSSVTEGKYDLAISALAYTPERAEAMNLSNGYYFDDEEDGYGLLVREEDPGVAVANNFRFAVDKETDGTRIGIPKGEKELTDKINEIVDELVESGQYKAWYDEYEEYAKSLGIE